MTIGGAKTDYQVKRGRVREKKRIALFIFLCALAMTPAARAQVELPAPMPNTYVHDFAQVIAEDKEAEIQAKATQLRETYKTEVAVVTIPSLQGEDSFDYSMRMARSWGIGSKDNEIRGFLILVAVQDRKTAFRTSRHIEGELPDGITGEISRQMGAYFKTGDFGGGLAHGLDSVLERLQVAYEPATANAKPASGGLGWYWLLIAGVPVLGGGTVLYVRRRRRIERAWQATRARNAEIEKNRRKMFAAMPSPSKRRRGGKKGKKAKSGGGGSAKGSYTPTYGSSSSSYSESSSSYSSDSSSSYDYGSSSSYDSGSSSDSSYSGGSDYGGGGSDSSW